MIDALAGCMAASVRTELDMFDWSGCWPVIDSDGRLTGAISEGGEEWTIVDISDGGTITPNGNDFAIGEDDFVWEIDGDE
jgi:hypothetical protein